MLRKGDYEIDTDTILGRGSFGIVHPAKLFVKGKISKPETVAAKRIDDKDEAKLSQAAVDLQRLVSLNHKNIARVYQVLHQRQSVWVFMELCEHGDLVDYLRKIKQGEEFISVDSKIAFMLDISKGVEYLHSKNIVHRDIKPSNILVSGVPAVAKLTDFDLSKFFDDPISTSLMTSNVGTQAFKAPEFFQRTPHGKINYHRNVDIFAMGLTFLGMIQENPGLCPKVETPNEESELHIPVGLLLWERKTYRRKPLTVVKLDGGAEGRNKRGNTVRKVIEKMTRYEPTDRIPAHKVVSEFASFQQWMLQWKPNRSEDQTDMQVRSVH